MAQVQTFTPNNNVLVSEAKDGTLHGKFTDIIMKEVAGKSLVMQLGKYVEMDGKQEKEFMIQTDGISAYWVDETKKISTSKPELVKAKLVAKKLGVILLASREALNYTWERFFEEMKPQIVDAFYQKIDDAGLFGHESPFANNVTKVITDNSMAIQGPINYENILKLEDKLYDNGAEPNAIVSKVQNRSALRESRDGNKVSVYDKATGKIDGITAVETKSAQMKTGDLIAGDFDNLVYGVPYNITYKISEEGTISTIKNADNTDINLFEQEMIALRATMDVAVLVIKDKSFAKLTASL